MHVIGFRNIDYIKIQNFTIWVPSYFSNDDLNKIILTAF